MRASDGLSPGLSGDGHRQCDERVHRLTLRRDPEEVSEHDEPSGDDPASAPIAKMELRGAGEKSRHDQQEPGGYRLTASFEYIGPADGDQAEALGVMDCRDVNM